MYLINMCLKKDVYPISSYHYYKTVKKNVKIKKVKWLFNEEVGDKAYVCCVLSEIWI